MNESYTRAWTAFLTALAVFVNARFHLGVPEDLMLSLIALAALYIAGRSVEKSVAAKAAPAPAVEEVDGL